MALEGIGVFTSQLTSEGFVMASCSQSLLRCSLLCSYTLSCVMRRASDMKNPAPVTSKGSLSDEWRKKIKGNWVMQVCLENGHKNGVRVFVRACVRVTV